MNRSNMAKILAAFIAGIVVTMGSLTYSRNHELSHFRKAAGNAESSTPVRIEASGSHSPRQESSKAPEDVTASSTPVPNVEAPSNERVSAQVPEPAVPKPAHPRRLRNRGWETAQNAPAGAPEAVTGDAASASAGSDDAWHTLPQTNPAQEDAHQASSAETKRSPSVVTLQLGTSINIQLEQNVSTDRNRSGDVFRGHLDSPLMVNGFVVAERGARVLGQVEQSKRARLLGSRADLRLTLTQISMADGQRVAIQTSPWEEKGAHASVGETPKMAAGAALGAVVGALTGAARGAGFVSEDAGARKNILGSGNKRNLVLTSGARLTFRVAAPVTITETLAPR